MTYSNKLAAQYLELAKLPVSQDNFAGSDARYSAEYEQLEHELAKASAVYGHGSIDWQKVREGSETLLTSHTKDLRVAAWLIWGLYQRESFLGLQAGLGVLNYLCLNHWTELYPRKMRTRAASINWLLPRLENAFSEHVPISGQLPLFTMLGEQLRALESFLSTHLNEEAPLLLPLCRRVDELVNRASQNQPAPGGVSAALAQVKQVAVQIRTSTEPVESEKEAHKSLRSLQDQARPLCAYWLKQKSSDLRALRLARTLLWLPIDSLPERNTENITALRNLPVDKLASYRERFSQRSYSDLLADLEASIGRAPFWLDGQRLAWDCLQALNAEQAMREVEIQLALFLQRMPGVEELRFHDGSPFADAETRLWISLRVMPHVQPEQITKPDQHKCQGSTTPLWELAFQEGLVLLREEGLKPAVQHLNQGLGGSSATRERFLWKLALARLCYHAKKYELAKPQLESLDSALQAGALTEWEPALALEVLRMLHSCCELLPQSHAVREHKEEIHRRLCHLDLEAVLD